MGELTFIFFSWVDFKDGTNIGKARTLLDHGADPNIKDRRGWTIVHQCAVSGNLPLLQLCIQRGGCIDEKNSEGKSPLDLAVLKHHEPIVEYLEKRSCNLKALCRHSVRTAMGKRTYNRINELPLPPSLKLFINYYNPYPGFTATVLVPRPWTEEEILSGDIEKAKVKEFFEENASEQFNADKNTSGINCKTSVEELAAMMETLYFWESFKAIEYEEPPARSPRYSMRRKEEVTEDIGEGNNITNWCKSQ